MEIRNQRTMCEFSHTIDNYEINGSAEVRNDKISYINGSIRSEQYGSVQFNYSETTDGKVNRSFSGAPKGVDFCTVVDSVVEAFSATLIAD